MQEYEVVFLKRAVPAIPFAPGTRGAVVFVHRSIPPAYEVEFVDEAGKTLGVYTVEESDLEVAC